MSRPKLLDLFSGAGGFSLGFEAAGFETVAFSEIEPFPCKVLEHRWPDVPNLGDVCRIDGEEVRERFGPIDVVTFGSPCQDWSVAGKRLGLEGERSSLFHEAIRVIRGVRPEFAVFENVPGIFSSAGGWDFAAVLDTMAESGAVDIAWSVLDAQWFGVPQRRRRVFVVADFRGERAGEILSIGEGVCRDTPPGREAGPAVTALSANGVGTCGADDNQAQGSHLIPEMAATLGGRRGWAPDMTFVPEVAGGQPTRYGKGANTTADDGAIVPVGIDGSDIGYTLRANPSHSGDKGDGGINTTMVALAFAENQRGEVRTSDTHPQLTTGGGKPGQGYPAVAVGVDGSDVGYSLRANPSHSGDKGDGGVNTTQVIEPNMAVRRLTPLECERLMGWPDGHVTGVPGASDSACYRACGNGVAAPVVEWIAERIREVM